MQAAVRSSFCLLQDELVLSLKTETFSPTERVCYLLFWKKLPLKMPASFLFTVVSWEAKKLFISHVYGVLRG